MAKSRKKSGLQPIGYLIKKVTGHLLDHPSSKAQRLWRDWRRAVGDHVAKHTEPIRLENGVLFIRVEHSVWMANLTFMKPQILQKLQKSYPAGTITDLHFREASLRNKIKNEPKKALKSLPPPLADEQIKAQKQVAEVHDPDLKILLGRLYESHLVRKRTDPDYRKR